MNPSEEESRYSIRSVERACHILDSFTRRQSEQTITEIAQRLGLSKATVLRLLTTLRQQGWVELDRFTGKYRLGFKMLEKGGLILAQLQVHRCAVPLLDRLTAECGEDSHLAVRDGTEIVYLYKSEGNRTLRASFPVGRRAPVHCTALGKALLSGLSSSEITSLLKDPLPRFMPNTIVSVDQLVEHLKEVRKRGYALDLEEFEEGIHCFGAPVRDYSGQVVAAVSISVPCALVKPEREAELVKLICACAEAVSTALGYNPRARSSGEGL